MVSGVITSGPAESFVTEAGAEELEEMAEPGALPAAKICIIGPPGAGKTTLIKQLLPKLSRYRFRYIDAHQRTRNLLGRPTTDAEDAGSLASGLISQAMESADLRGNVIIEGYPNLEQDYEQLASGIVIVHLLMNRVQASRRTVLTRDEPRIYYFEERFRQYEEETLKVWQAIRGNTALGITFIEPSSVLGTLELARTVMQKLPTF